MSPDDGDEVDLALEWKLRAVAIPAAFVLAFAFHASETGHALQRTFLSMVPHELGHAVTAWWCGYAALPGLWKTLIPEARSAFVILALAAIQGGVAVHGWRTNRTWLVALAAGLAAVQFLATTSTTTTAGMAFTFGGDAGAMVIGTLLVLAFFAPAGSWFRAGGVRWGLLAIGAAALVDTSATWWTARHDPDVIPFGEIEGVGLSDPSKLDEVYGWTTQQMVHRYVTVTVICCAVVAVVWGWGVWDARRRARM